MSATKAQTTFWISARLMGASLSSIFLIYTGASITRVFFITAGTFGAMSIYGYTTKRDLTKLFNDGSLWNYNRIFSKHFYEIINDTFCYINHWCFSICGLTAYDTQN